MRKAIILLILILSFSKIFATNYWLSPNGNDNNSGSLASPWLTFTKACTVLTAGDTLFLRGGTYLSTAGNAASTHFSISNINGTSSNYIVIMPYQNELPQFSCANITPTNAFPFAFVVSGCNYVILKNFKVKMLRQIADGSGVSRGFAFVNSNNCTARNLDIFCIGGTGVTLITSNGCSFINCDSHNNGDGASPGGEQWNFGDGFTATGNDTSTDILFDSCRAWMNGDDNMDYFQWGGQKTTIRNSLFYFASVKPWGISGTQPDENNMTPLDTSVFYNRQSYYTVTLGASGEGIKCGGCNPPGCPSPAPNTTKKYLYNNVSFMNNGTGYAANMAAQYSHRMLLENNISYCNNNDGYGWGTGRSVGIAMIFKNDWGWLNNRIEPGADFVYDGLPDSISNNVWMTVQGNNYGNLKPPVNVSAADFISVDFTTAITARSSDGTLPPSNFMKLAPTSDLVNAGINVGQPFCGSAPDVNAFEYCPTTFPTVSIGSDQTITLPVNSVNFTPTVTNGTSYAWSTYSGSAGTFSNPTSINTSYGNLNTVGVRGVRLCVTNASGTICDSALVTVNAGATAPTCNAGTSPVSITLPVQTVALSGTGASTSGNTVSFLWGFTLGSGTIANNTAQNTTATMTTANSYAVSLLVTDLSNGLTCTSTKSITVNPALVVPVANAGVDQTITLPTNSVTLTGSGSGGTINSYQWTLLQGNCVGCNFSAPTSATTNFTGLTQGVYLVRLRVGNTDGNFGYDSVTITVLGAPTAPTCNAGVTPVTITLPINTAALSATGASTSGNTVSFAWVKLSGTGGSITNANTANATATGLVAGTYVYRVTVTDNANSLTCTSDKTVIVNNSSPIVAPTCNAGADQTISLPTTSTTLTGTAVAGNGVITAYLWQKLAGSPTGGTITSSTSASTTITGLIAGVYQYSLTVTQTEGLTKADTVQITVQSTTTGNGIRYVAASIYGTDVNIGWTFDYSEYSGANYMIAQERINNVFYDLQPRIIPTTQTVDYWYFLKKVKRGTYYFRIGQVNKDGTKYYSKVVSVKKN